MGDDDDEQGGAEGAMNVVKYPVMPSLVSLQQMRNRLHLAFLGRKLMKWTAMATGKEQRRLSAEIGSFLTGYREEVINAYILLARCRYFLDNMNYIVLESMPPSAIITVKSTSRSVSGVKVRNLNVVEIGVNGYQYLGLGNGGMAIKQAREAWLALIKKMVFICQFRVTFDLIDIAHKNATKAYNKLTKEIIPQLISRINEISTELEKKRRKELLLKTKTDKRKIKKTVDELLKKVIIESTIECLGADSNNGDAVRSNNDSKSSLINNLFTSQETVNAPHQKYRPVTLNTMIVQKTLVDNETQPIIGVDQNTQPIIKGIPSKNIKENVDEKDKDASKNNLTIDDELLLFQHIPNKYLKSILNKEILPYWKGDSPFLKQRHKIFVMDQQTAQTDDQQSRKDSTPSKETYVLTESQHSREVPETSHSQNSTTSQNQKTASTSKKISKNYQQIQNPNTIVISDSTNSTKDQQPLNEIKLTEERNKRAKIMRHQNKTQVAGTSNQRSPKISYASIKSETNPTEKISSKLSSGFRFTKVPPKAPKDNELIVLKLPEESDCCDEFIPPVAEKKFAVNGNIIKIEELSEDEADDEETAEIKPKVTRNGEAFETGEWLETATTNSNGDSLNGLSTRSSRKASLTNSELHSKSRFPSEENSESHIQVADYPSEAIEHDVAKVLKLLKTNQTGSSSSSFVSALDFQIPFLEQFDTPNDFDRTFQQFLDIKKALDDQESENSRNSDFEEDTDLL